MKLKSRQRKYPLSFFYRQLAMLIHDGRTIQEAITLIAEETQHSLISGINEDITNNIQKGVPLHDVLKLYPSTFTALVSNLVKYTHKGELLASALAKVADRLDAENEMKRYSKKKFIYPVIILIAAVIVFLTMSIYVLPVYGKMLSDFGHQFPPMTQNIIGISNSIGQNFFKIAACFIIFFFFFARNKLFRQFICGILPSIRKSQQYAYLSYLLNNIGIALSAKMPFSVAYSTAIAALGDDIFNRKMKRHGGEVYNPEDFMSIINKTKLLHPEELHIIAVGSKTANMDSAFLWLADSYEMQWKLQTQSATDRLATYILIILGFLIGYFVISMYLPMFKMGAF